MDRVIFSFGLKSNLRNVKMDKRRNRRGGTSPLLACIETNPGPKTKATRKLAKKEEEPKRKRKYHQLDEKTKGKIAMGLDNGLTREEIIRQLELGKSTVQTWADRYENEGHMDRRSGSGRPRATTKSDDRWIEIQCKRNRRLTAVALEKTIRKQDGTPKVTVQTVRNRLLDAGYPARIARKKPLLTKMQKKNRLAWAKEHKDWTENQWRKVLWSDETSFSLFPRAGHQYVRRQPGEGMRDDCLSKTVKHGGGSIMIWGCFHASGVGVLKRITGHMDQNQYHSILTHTVMPEMKRLAQDEPTDIIWTFQHDNDPKHTAKKNKKYLERKENEGKINFSVLPWSSQSPDLNPTEQLWNYIKNGLRDREDRPANLDELFEFVKQEWEKIPKDYLRTLVDSLPRRIAAVIKNRGGSTSY